MPQKQRTNVWLLPQVFGVCLIVAVSSLFAQTPPPYWDNFDSQKVFVRGRMVCEGAEDVSVDEVGQWVYIYGRSGTKWSKWSVEALLKRAETDSNLFSCLENSKTLGRPQRSSMLVRFISGQSGNTLAFDTGTKRLWQLDSTMTALSSLGLPVELQKENLNEWFFKLTSSHRLIGYRTIPSKYYVWEETQGSLKSVWEGSSIQLAKENLDIAIIGSNNTHSICFERSAKAIVSCDSSLP